MGPWGKRPSDEAGPRGDVIKRGICKCQTGGFLKCCLQWWLPRNKPLGEQMRPEKEVSDPAPGRATSVSMRKLRHIKRPIEQHAFYGLGTFYFSCAGTGTGRCTQRARTALNELADPLGRHVGKQAHGGRGPRRRLETWGPLSLQQTMSSQPGATVQAAGGPERRALAHLLQAGAMPVQVSPWSLMLEPQRNSFRPQTPGECGAGDAL